MVSKVDADVLKAENENLRAKLSDQKAQTDELAKQAIELKE